MNELNRIFNLIKGNLTIIVFLLYGLGFINYYLYYKVFNIQIFNYLAINDLLFYVFEYLFKLVIFVFVYEVVLFVFFTLLHSLFFEKIMLYKKNLLYKYLLESRNNKERITAILQTKFSKRLNEFKLSITLLSLFFLIWVPYKLVVLPTVCLYVFYLNEKSYAGKTILKSVKFALVIILIFMLFSTLNNAYHKRYYKDQLLISFVEGSSYVTTDKSVSCLNYIGETSSHIFLFDIETKESRICIKSNITELKIKDDNTLNSVVESFNRSSLVKIFRPLFKNK